MGYVRLLSLAFMLYAPFPVLQALIYISWFDLNVSMAKISTRPGKLISLFATINQQCESV